MKDLKGCIQVILSGMLIIWICESMFAFALGEVALAIHMVKPLVVFAFFYGFLSFAMPKLWKEKKVDNL